MSRPNFDLQAHSLHSDGVLSVRDVVSAAASAGVLCVALTDHDTVDGVDEGLVAARDFGVEFVVSTEISIVDDAAADLHVLGYGFDHREPRLVSALEGFRADRLSRSDRMAANLRAAGLDVEDGALRERRSAGLPVGRPHLAQAVLDHPANRERFARERITSVADMICAYLIVGRPGFAERETPTAREAVDLIHEAGGLAVWAHPFWDIKDPDTVLSTLERFVGLGLDGVEAFYVTHDAVQARLLVDAAARHGLLTTGSSDFHGPEHPLFSSFRAFSLYDLEPNLGDLAGDHG